MKIYIVMAHSGWGDDFHIIGVFASKETADAKAADCTISERESDERGINPCYTFVNEWEVAK
jgi:hypothetical protein